MEVIACNKAGLQVIITLKEVIYVPGLKDSSNGLYLRLLSVSKATQAGCHCTFSYDEDVINLLTCLM